MNISQWFIRAEELRAFEAFFLLPLDAQELSEIETDQLNNYWKYRSIAQLKHILRIPTDTLIVLSTEEALMAAARYAWMLHWLGYARVRILIGPIDPTWKTRPRPSFSRLPASAPLRPQVRMTCADLFEAFRSSNTALVDVRTYAEYSGQIRPRSTMMSEEVYLGGSDA